MEERSCISCRWYNRSADGPECRFFDRDRDRARWPETAKSCCFYEGRNAAAYVAKICEAIFAVAEAIEKFTEEQETC